MERELVRRADVDALTDGICGVTLTALSSLRARVVRRSIERVVFEVRTELAKVCLEMADRAVNLCSNSDGQNDGTRAAATKTVYSVANLALPARNWQCGLVFLSYQMDPNSPR